MAGKALITEAGTPLGRALALHLAGRGYDVALHCTTAPEEAASTAAEARAMGVTAAVTLADFLDEAVLTGLVSQAVAALGGPLTLLVINATGYDRDTPQNATGDGRSGPVGSPVHAPIMLTRAFAAQAPRCGRDAAGEPMAQAMVVNMIDQRMLKPTPELMSGTVAMMNLRALTRAAAQALAPAIRVNAIALGSGVQGTRQHAASRPERGADMADVTATLSYFLDASVVTGQILMVDDGQHPACHPADVAGVV